MDILGLLSQLRPGVKLAHALYVWFSVAVFVFAACE